MCCVWRINITGSPWVLTQSLFFSIVGFLQVKASDGNSGCVMWQISGAKVSRFHTCAKTGGPDSRFWLDGKYLRWASRGSSEYKYYNRYLWLLSHTIVSLNLANLTFFTELKDYIFKLWEMTFLIRIMNLGQKKESGSHNYLLYYYIALWK